MHKALRKLLYRNYWRRDRYRIYRRLGLDLLLNYANYIDRQLIIKEPYETRQLAHFRQQLGMHRYAAVIDVGANLGLYSLIAAQSGNVADILAFEPDPRNYRQLQANLRLNRLTGRVRTFPVGLGRSDAGTTFLQENGRSTGQSRVAATAPADTNLSRYTKTKIDVIQFDSHFSYSHRDILVKIDVEGHEQEVIAGMRSLLAGNRCQLQVEVFDASLGAVGDLLGKLGYAKTLEFGYDRIFSNRLHIGE
jgi:FkbM family methyltransferase